MSRKRTVHWGRKARQQPGLRVEDIDEAVCDAIERLATILTPRNANAYLSDLPQDIDVVAVAPIARPAKRVHRYYNTI